ncbi:MAG: SDR family NAD(P)-dependent oxidoreductase, partial [Deltaproteobacteria bacterium]|nr:SDR family NAD(P)-dependent oxidoreductase [Deltaproteobacteria bacterium]
MALFQGKNVLITGASSGIGESLAKEFASQGANLVLMARRKSRLDEVKAELKQNYPSINILTFETDVTLDNSVANSVKLALAEMGNLDVVVANAGFGVAGNVSQLSLEDYRRQF